MRVALATLVLLFLATALVLLARRDGQDVALETRPAVPLVTGSTGVAAARRASPEEVRAYLNDMFDRLDRDGSGYVEIAEAPRLQMTSARLGDGTIRQRPLMRAEWFAQGDGNGDGRVTRTEYFARLIPPVQSLFGVPADWRPSDGEPGTGVSRQR